MNSPFPFFLAVVLLSLNPTSKAAEPGGESISIDDLRKMKVIGELGVPMGEVATIRAEIVDEGDRKGHWGDYRLRVSHVNKKKFEGQLDIQFVLAPGCRAPLANSHFGLYELRSGEKAGSLTSEQIEVLNEGYVGETVVLQVYELGGFTGIAKDLPDGVVSWQGLGYFFNTYLRVLKMLDE